MQHTLTPAVPQGLSAFGAWITKVFRLWSANRTVWILQGLIFFVIVGGLALLFDLCFYGTTSIIAVLLPPDSPVSTPLAPISFIWFIAMLNVFTAYCMICGMISSALKQLHGNTISVIDLFGAVRFSWGAIVCTVFIALGLLVCYFGAMATFSLYFLAVPLMIDRKMPTFKALRHSWRTVSENFWLYTFFALTMTCITLVGAVLCYLGLACNVFSLIFLISHAPLLTTSTTLVQAILFDAGVILTIPFLFIAQAVACYRTFE